MYSALFWAVVPAKSFLPWRNWVVTRTNPQTGRQEYLQGNGTTGSKPHYFIDGWSAEYAASQHNRVIGRDLRKFLAAQPRQSGGGHS